MKHGQEILYSKKLTQEDFNDCLANKYIDKNMYNCLSVLNNSNNVDDWLAFSAEIIKLIALRWSSAEVIAGSKQCLREYITLSEAVDLFVTKIDMSFVYNGFFTEMSNIFITERTSKHGLVFYPVSAQPKYYEEAIKYNLFEYLNNKDLHLLKALKRLYTLALLFNDKIMLEKIAPILVSDVGRLNKVSNIMSTCVDLIEKLPQPPVEQIKQQINNLKPVLANIYEFSFDEKYIDQVMDDISSAKYSKDKMAKKLDEIIIYFNDIINAQTKQYIKDYRIIIGKQYLP